MSDSVLISALIVGTIAGIAAGAALTRRGWDGITVGTAGGFTILVAFLVITSDPNLNPPMQRAVGLAGLGLFFAGFGIIAAGALAAHFANLRKRCEKEWRREFRFLDLFKGQTFWIWWCVFIGGKPVADLIRYRGSELRERLIGDAYMSGLYLAAFLLLICADLWLVRRWRRHEGTPVARDAA